MTGKLQINSGSIQNEELILTIEDAELEEFIATGKMLADSEQSSFIYIIEKGNDYTYIVLTENVWPLLKQAVDQQTKVFVTNSRERLLLTGFYEELIYLINNIKGNYNYGEEMVAKVEEIFF